MKQPTKLELVKGLLLDPFKGAIVDVLLPAHSVSNQRWHSLLDADMVEVSRCELAIHGPHGICVDEAGYLREPQPYPQFKVAGANAGQPFAGYGIVLGLSPDRTHFSDVRISNAELARLVQFENWEKRLKPDDYLPQLMRLYLPWP